MMNTRHMLLAAAVLSLLLVLTGGIAHAQDDCPPGFFTAYMSNRAAYDPLFDVIGSELDTLEAELRAVVDEPTYANFLAHARTIAANPSIQNGRVVVTVPDGTVMIDTAKT